MIKQKEITINDVNRLVENDEIKEHKVAFKHTEKNLLGKTSYDYLKQFDALTVSDFFNSADVMNKLLIMQRYFSNLLSKSIVLKYVAEYDLIHVKINDEKGNDFYLINLINKENQGMIDLMKEIIEPIAK